MVRVAIDAVGGDRAPDEVVAGAVAAHGGDIAVLLVGPEATVRAAAPAHGGLPAGIEVVDAPDIIAMDEHPAAAVRGKPRSSIVVGVGLVKQGLADAFVSAGNSGATMAAGLLVLGRMEGIERPAIATLFPTISGKLLLLDVGANADCRPQHLLQFARLGADYMARVYGVEEPRVGLLSIGEEPSKGNALTIEAHALLAASDLSFVGNIEGKDIPRGDADVVVCDGFAGNVVIKTAEGSAEFIFNSLRDEVRRDLRSRLGALLLRPALRRLYRRLDYTEYGAAPLLGLRGLVMIAHGRSDRRAIASAVRAAAAAARAGAVGRSEAAILRGDSSTE